MMMDLLLRACRLLCRPPHMAPLWMAVGTSAALHVSKTFDDLSVADAHDGDATDAVLTALAPAKLPENDAAIAYR
jgi:hypothetical protein